MCNLLQQFRVWFKLVGACLQAFGGKEGLSQFRIRVMCPHCLEAMTLKEALQQGHFLIVSWMQWLTLLCLCAPANVPRQPLGLKPGQLVLLPTSRWSGLRRTALLVPLTVCMAWSALQNYRKGTTDQLLVSKPKTGKRRCGVTHDQPPAKKANNWWVPTI